MPLFFADFWHTFFMDKISSTNTLEKIALAFDLPREEDNSVKPEYFKDAINELYREDMRDY